MRCSEIGDCIFAYAKYCIPSEDPAEIMIIRKRGDKAMARYYHERAVEMPEVM